MCTLCGVFPSRRIHRKVALVTAVQSCALPISMRACSAIHINIFGPHPSVVFGADEQKARWVPDLVQGRVKSCFGVTEPDAGLNTTRIKTRAEKSGNGYVVNGRKVWTPTAQEAGKIMLPARTTPIERCRKPTDGMSLLYTRLDSKQLRSGENTPATPSQ